MTILPSQAEGQFAYNGFNFPPAVRTKCAISPVQDSTGRITKYVRYQITAEFIVYLGLDSKLSDGSDNDDAIFPDTADTIDGIDGADGMDQLRHLLTRQGKELIFNNKGLGAKVEVNTSNSEKELMYGPVPELLQWEPIASNKAARVVWQCSFALRDCGTSTKSSNPIEDQGYEVTYSIDAYGHTTRTVSGYLMITNYLVSSGTSGTSVYPNASADEYRHKIKVALPLGFQRVRQDYKISKDQRTLTYTIVDKEHSSELPVPSGVIDLQVNHTISSSGKLLNQTWDVAVSGSFTMAAGFDKALAYQAFLAIVRSRWEAAKKYAKLPGESKESDNRILIPRKLTINDSIYDRSISFSMNWTMYTTLKTVNRAGGLFLKPDKAYTWQGYKADMTKARGAWSSRGHKNLRHKASSSKVSSLCAPNAYIPPISDLFNEKSIADTYTVFGVSCPAKKDSWTFFMPRVMSKVKTNNISIPVTGGLAKWADKFKQLSATSDIKDGAKFTEQVSPGGNKRIVNHTRSLPVNTIAFYGTVERIGFKIPKPSLKSYGGAPATPIGEMRWSHNFMGKAGECNIYQAFWYQEYQLETTPEGEEIIPSDEFKGIPQS